MTAIAFLEDFEVAPPPPGPADGPSDDWRAGREAGLAEAAEYAATEQALLTETLVQAVADAAFDHAQARAAVWGGLGPLFTDVVTRFLPDLADAAFVPRIVAHLTDAARADADATLTVHVAPTRVAAVTHALAVLAGRGVACRSDPTLGDGQAMFRVADTETALDLDALRADMADILSAAIPHPPRKDATA